jgi:hypothetical protein
MALRQGLISGEVIPVQSRLSARQDLLAVHLAERLKKAFPEAGVFFPKILSALSPDGDCSGLAALSLEGRSLLAVFMDAEMRYLLMKSGSRSLDSNDVSHVIERLDTEILRLAKDPDWLDLKHPPKSVKNRFLFFHYSTFTFPAYPLLVPLLQRGMCAKRTQLSGLPGDASDRRMGGFLQPVMHILRHIPPESVRASMMDYAPGELDEIIRGVIGKLPRKVAGPFHRTVYTHATRVTYWNNWLEAFHAKAGDREFHSRRFFRRSACPVLDLADFDDEELERDPSHKKFLEISFAQQAQEEREISIHKRNGAVAKRNGACKMRSDSIAIQLTPSSSMPGCLPLVVLAMIRAFMDAVPDDEPEINTLTRRLLVQCMLHFGRRPEWLLLLQIGKRPGSIRGLRHPVLDMTRYRIYYRPDLYLGIPERLTPPHGEDEKKWAGHNAAWENHDLIYDNLSLVREIQIPPPLRDQFEHVYKARKKAIQKVGDTDLDSDTGQFFLWQEGNKIVPLSLDHVQGIFKDLSNHVRGFIPDFPGLRPSHLCRSFEGWFAELGTSGVHRYYVSEKLFPQAEMPIRYSHIRVCDIEKAHRNASVKLEASILKEMKCLGFETKRSEVDWEDPKNEDAALSEFVGSWRCAREDCMRAVVKELQASAYDPEIWDPGIPRQLAERNRQIRLAAVCLSLLNGIRPMELLDLRAQNVDLPGLRISIHGKPHQKRSAYRCLPILPEMGLLLKEIIQSRNGGLHPRRRIFGFFSQDGRWSPATTAQLNDILIFAGNRQGFRFMPDFYSLRHRFRTDWTALGAPEFLLNYMMGHEAKGFEFFGVHQDTRLEGLDNHYRKYATQLAERYGVSP